MRERQIILPQVDPISIHRQGEIAPIIHEEQRTSIRGCPSELGRLAIGLSHRRGLITILKQPDPVLCCLRQHVHEGTLGRGCRVQDHVETLERPR